jgi:hypothetical protein
VLCDLLSSDNAALTSGFLLAIRPDTGNRTVSECLTRLCPVKHRQPQRAWREGIVDHVQAGAQTHPFLRN